MAQSDSVPLGPGKQHARSLRPIFDQFSVIEIINEPYFAARPPNKKLGKSPLGAKLILLRVFQVIIICSFVCSFSFVFN